MLNEIVAVATRKLGRPLEEVREFLLDIRRLLINVVALDVDLHVEALALMARYGFSIYDSLIVAAGLRANCTTLHSEDLQHGQIIDGRLTVRNPFS